MADNFSPSGAVAATLQEILLRKKMDARQTMLDKMAQEAADLKKRETEANMEAQRGQTQVAFENLGLNQQQLQAQRDEAKALAEHRAAQNQMNFEQIGQQAEQLRLDRETRAPRPLTTVNDLTGRISTDPNTIVPPNLSVQSFGRYPPSGGSGGVSTQLKNNYRVTAPDGSQYEQALDLAQVKELESQGAKVLRLTPDQTGLMGTPTNQLMTAAREALATWDQEYTNARAGMTGLGRNLTESIGVRPSETPRERQARQNAEVAVTQLTTSAPPDLLDAAQEFLQAEMSGKKVQLDPSEYTKDELDVVNNLINNLRVYYRMKAGQQTSR